jgi:hypothetical protein
MNFIGKFLVLVNVLVSFGIFTAALILYLWHVDYTDQGPAKKGDEAAYTGSTGELWPYKETLKEIDPQLHKSAASARDARQELNEVEGGYVMGRGNAAPADRDFYREEMLSLDKALPGHTLHDIQVAQDQSAQKFPDWVKKVTDDGYQVILVRARPDPKAGDLRYSAIAIKDAKENPKDPAGKPLLTRAELRATERDLVEKIAKAQAMLDELTAQDIKLTNEIIGTPDGLTKGLRRRLGDEKIKLAEMLKEAEVVRPLWINSRAEKQLIRQREKALEDRLEELRRGNKDR